MRLLDFAPADLRPEQRLESHKIRYEAAIQSRKILDALRSLIFLRKIRRRRRKGIAIGRPQRTRSIRGCQKTKSSG